MFRLQTWIGTVPRVNQSMQIRGGVKHSFFVEINGWVGWRRVDEEWNGGPVVPNCSIFHVENDAISLGFSFAGLVVGASFSGRKNPRERDTHSFFFSFCLPPLTHLSIICSQRLTKSRVNWIRIETTFHHLPSYGRAADTISRGGRSYQSGQELFLFRRQRPTAVYSKVNL